MVLHVWYSDNIYLEHEPTGVKDGSSVYLEQMGMDTGIEHLGIIEMVPFQHQLARSGPKKAKEEVRPRGFKVSQ